MPFQKGYKPPVKWLPGQSGNPSGKPRGSRELDELARSHSPAAVKHIVKLMHGECHTYTRRGLRVPVPVPPQTQLAAAVALIERGFGKPVQPIAGDKESPVLLQRIERVIVHGSDGALRILDADAEPAPDGPPKNGYTQ